MSIHGIVQVFIEQTPGRFWAIVAYIRSLLLDHAESVHEVRTQLIAPQALPAWYPTLMVLMLIAHISSSACIPILTAIGFRILM